MKTSEHVNEIAAALSRAQAKIRNAEKTAENPGFKRGNKAATYADLASVWDACRSALTENGISVAQGPETDGATVRVETMLLHSSGQWMATTLSATAANASPQAVGSAITYLRRYGLAAMVGVAPADDDGEAAEGRDTPAGRKPLDPKASQGAADAVRAAAKRHPDAKPIPTSPEARKADLKARMAAMHIPGADMAKQLGEWIGRVVDKDTVLTADDWTRADTAIEQTKGAAETLHRSMTNGGAAEAH